ncbi:hypothetical protein C8R45DRAFT_942232 [Mycena sanguinolenta]|nr:hypothetical protein C8R45DRAFT_942232 [Mycena sanguinolenta]
MTSASNPPAFNFDWGVANVSVPLPASRNPLPATPSPLGEVKFTPVGVFDVRRHLGATVPEFNRLRHRYNAADFAFTVAGASEDSNHSIPASEFFPEFFELYQSLPTGRPGQTARREFSDRSKRLLFDMATKYDRATAGTTFIVHVNGTTVPNSPVVPERLKADVYLPPHFLAHHPEAHAAVAFLVQTVIEKISIPTVNDWRSKAERLWSLTQTGHLPPVVPPAVLIPQPINNRSAHYVFPGRPWNQLTLPTPTAPPTQPGLAPLDEEDLAIFDIDEITDLATAVARAEAAEAEIDVLRETIEALQALNVQMQTDFQSREESFEAELQFHAKTIVRLETELRVAKTFFPSSSSVSQRGPTTPLRRAVPGSPSHELPSTLRFVSPRRESPMAFGLQSPRQGTPSADDKASFTTVLTDVFLEKHSLTSFHNAVVLVMRFVSPVQWKDELIKLSGLNADLVNGLSAAMDEDYHGNRA